MSTHKFYIHDGILLQISSYFLENDDNNEKGTLSITTNKALTSLPNIETD